MFDRDMGLVLEAVFGRSVFLMRRCRLQLLQSVGTIEVDANS